MQNELFYFYFFSAYIQNITEEINTDDLLFPDTLYEGLLGLDSILTADIMKLDPL